MMSTQIEANSSETNSEDISPRLILGLILTAVVCALLAVFQWMELIVAQRGGSLSCSINETFNCAVVWNAPFAKAVHANTFVPVAGWGLIWSLGALVVALRLNLLAHKRAVLSRHIFIVRLFAVAGVLSSIGLGAVSFSLGAVCLTCIGTYWLVFSYAFCAYLLNRQLLPQNKRVIVPEMGKALAICLGAYLILYYPGLKTPQKEALALAQVVPENAQKKGQRDEAHKGNGHAHDAPEPKIPTTISELLENFPPQSKQAFSDALTRIRLRKKHDVSKWPTRFIKGSKDAPAKMVEFTDIKCGHCARLVMELKELERLAGPGKLSIEPRQFPLDYECNKSVDSKMSDGTGVRCAAAKSLICLEGKDAYWTAQLEMFKQGPGLTKEKVMEIASAAAQDEAGMVKCVADAETQAKLDQDIEYAMKHDLHGTPLVLINGKEVDPIGALMFGLILAGGDPDHPAFKTLPSPSPEAFRDPHEGHAH